MSALHGQRGQSLRCVCGGHVYTLNDLVALSADDPEGIGYADMYRSFMGPFDLYCSDDDEVLTEEEVWRVYGLTTPVHDEPDPVEFPDFPMELTL